MKLPIIAVRLQRIESLDNIKCEYLIYINGINHETSAIKIKIN